jgi:hypothetical protein
MRITFASLLSCALTVTAHAQVISYQVLDPLQAVLDRLVGPNVTVLDAVLSNSPEQFASFTDSTAGIGTTGGLLLVTGVHYVVIGPNNTDNASFGTFPTLLDEDLYNLSIPNSGTTDIARLDLDLIPWGDTLSIRFVFGSEEYDEWVCSVKDDRVGMFLSGPGIAGPFTNAAINIATLPESGLPVTVNTVNNGVAGTNGNTGLCNINAGWQLDTVNFVDNDFGQGTQLDGYTRVLTARAVVQPGEVYHLRIAIADLDDGNFDSAVFLCEGSLQCNDLPTSVIERERGSGNVRYQASTMSVVVPGFDAVLGGVAIRVFDTTGRLVASGTGGLAGDAYTLPFVGPMGVYMVHATQGDRVLSGRVLVP